MLEYKKTNTVIAKHIYSNALKKEKGKTAKENTLGLN